MQQEVLDEANQKLQLVQDKLKLMKQVLTQYRQLRTGGSCAGPGSVQLSPGHGLSPTGSAGRDLQQDGSTGVMCIRPTTWALLSVHLVVELHTRDFS